MASNIETQSLKNESDSDQNEGGDKPQAPSFVPAVDQANGDFRDRRNGFRQVTLKRDFVDVFNAIVLFFAFVAASVAAFQAARLADLTNTAIINADAVAERQSKDTQNSLALTKEAAEAATRSAEAATRSANLAEAGARAWIAPVTFSFVNLTDNTDPLKIRVTYQNVGREPAKNVSIWTTLDHITSPKLGVSLWSELEEWRDTVRFDPKELCKFVTTTKVALFTQHPPQLLGLI
jgi:hypothetical protein